MSSAAIPDYVTLNLPQASVSAAVRNLLLTFALAVASLAMAGYLQGPIGYEMLIVAMGWPHIILGFLFYFGKVVRGEWRARSSFFLLAILTLVLWAAHYSYMITGFISIYFTYHVFRDELFIYFQTRARHKLRGAVYVAGVVPFILLMFLVTDPRPQHYRQDLRRVDLTESQLSPSGWALIPFEPISYSGGKEFYFYMQAPRLKGMSGYRVFATTADSQSDGELRVSDKKWPEASRLIFKPYYADTSRAEPADAFNNSGNVKLPISGDYRLGQTFKAEQDNLAGIWMRTTRVDDKDQDSRFVFHLTTDTSLPMGPLSPALQLLRWALVLILSAVVLWKAVPHLRQNRTFWFYFLGLIAVFGLLQKTIGAGSRAGLDLPIMFQLVVVFHYWSWYVFSFDRILTSQVATAPPALPKAATLYDRLLASLRNVSNFTMLVIALNLISAAGVLWYSKLNGPAPLRFIFNYSYFLYFLVFHVTFSFGPKQSSRKMNTAQTSLRQNERPAMST